MELVETLKVNANYLTVYNSIIDGKPQSRTFDINFTDTFHDCRMSAAAVKTIKKAVNVILYLARRQHFAQSRRTAKVSCTGFRQNYIKTTDGKKSKDKPISDYLCSFITLTLPSKQTHTDKELTEFAINPFLSYCRKMWGVRYYIWKKELQKNGNLHFHLITDRYIRWDKLRETWNRIINRGKVDKCETPFDYVDRYTAKMRQRYANGWDINKMFAIAKESPYVQQRADEAAAEIEKKEKRELSDVEYNYIFLKENQKEYRKMFAAYNAEIYDENGNIKPEEERWLNPNSTDISAIKTPRGISAYVAKYIAKDIDDNNELSTYQKNVDMAKDKLKKSLLDIAKKLQNGETVTELDNRAVEHWRSELSLYREDCPIKGKLWFKSATLTPFLTGATEYINRAIYDDLIKLKNYLLWLQDKDGKKYIVHSYELNEKGEPTNKIICTTLLYNVFALLMQRNKNGSYKFPEISTMWYKFVNDCVKINKQRGLYELSQKEMLNLNSFNKN